MQPPACKLLWSTSACDVQVAEEASGQPPASVLASTGSPTQSMAMRVAAIVQGSQSGTLDELWQLFCTLQVCPRPGASSQACRTTSHDCVRLGVRSMSRASSLCWAQVIHVQGCGMLRACRSCIKQADKPGCDHCTGPTHYTAIPGLDPAPLPSSITVSGTHPHTCSRSCLVDIHQHAKHMTSTSH